MTEDDFDALIRRVRAGDPDARGELYARYGRLVRLAVRRQLPDRLRQEYDSLDFAHDVWASFVALPPDRVAFPTPAALAGFLTRVAHNKVIDEVRRRFSTRAYDVAREVPLPGPGDPGGEPAAARDPSPSQWAIAGERWAELLACLPPAHRAILERLRDGWSHAEIAAEAGVGVRTVERVVRRLKDLCGRGPE